MSPQGRSVEWPKEGCDSTLCGEEGDRFAEVVARSLQWPHKAWLQPHRKQRPALEGCVAQQVLGARPPVEPLPLAPRLIKTPHRADSSPKLLNGTPLGPKLAEEERGGQVTNTQHAGYRLQQVPGGRPLGGGGEGTPVLKGLVGALFLSSNAIRSP